MIRMSFREIGEGFFLGGTWKVISFLFKELFSGSFSVLVKEIFSFSISGETSLILEKALIGGTSGFIGFSS